MKTKKIDIFNKDDNKIREEFKELLSDKSIVNDTNTIYNYCKKNNLIFEKEALIKCQKIIEKDLEKSCHQFAIIQYQLSVLTNDWLESGESQNKQTFYRHILRLPPHKLLETGHYDQCEEIIKKKLAKYQIVNASIQDLKYKIKNYTFRIASKSFEKSQINKLNQILTFLESDKRIILTNKAGYKYLYYAKVKKRKVGTYEVGFIEKEIVRSPFCIMSLAALSFERNVYIRREVVETIFYQKWRPYFEHIETMPWSIQYSRERNVSEGIKKHIYGLSHINSTQDITENKENIIKDISETIIFHELGHVIINQDIMDITVGSTLEATKQYGHNIFITLLEILADLAPESEKIQGPIINLCKLAKKNKDRATRMFFMYVSDVWFYDTDDQYMYDYADLILLILTQYIESDLTVNFEKIEYDLSKEAINREQSLMSYLTVQCAEASLSIQRIILNADYIIAGKKAEIKGIKQYIETKFKENGSSIDKTSYSYNTSFWSVMVNYASLYTTNKTAVKDFIEAKRIEILNEIFERTAGDTHAQKYNYNAKDYILDTFEKLNLKVFS